MRDNTLKLLGLMRVAGAIEIGADRAGDCAAAGKARLLLLPSDAGQGAKNKAGRVLEGRNAIELELPFSRAELAGALGVGDCTMAAVTDMGFSLKLLEQLCAIEPERYAAPAAALKAKQEKMLRRKSEKGAKGHDKTNGKRRTKL